MSYEKNTITSPIARLIEGSLTKPNESNMMGKKYDKPRYYFAVAIPKRTEKHWKETPWGQRIVAVAEKSFIKGETTDKEFSWKIMNGDDDEERRNRDTGRTYRICDKPGFAENWIIKFSTVFKVPVRDRKGIDSLPQHVQVNLGDYIQVGFVPAANSQPGEVNPHPGMYLNPRFIAFQAYGPRIEKGLTAADFDFGNEELPADASEIPVGGISTDVRTEDSKNSVVHKMTDRATHTYEEYLALGFNDELLIQAGLMSA